MYGQLSMYRHLVGGLIEKVEEYCNEADCWKSGTQLWTCAATGDVVLGEKPLQSGYEGRDVDGFVCRNEGGVLVPDIDLIEDYASGWFDFRLVK